MKKYNREKRATYKQNTRSQAHNATYDECDGQARIKRIHIPIKYDGYDKTTYTIQVYIRRRINKDALYVDIPNAIYDIFPEISTHKRHIYKGNAPYKRHIITPYTDYMPPQDMMKPYVYTYTNIDRVKCIIYNEKDEIIHYGIFTRKKQKDEQGLHITLHRADRQIEVYPYIPMTDTIYGVQIRDIYKHGVEIYKV